MSTIGIVFTSVGLFMVLFWPFTLLRALLHLSAHAYFGEENPISNAEHRRFILSAVLLASVMTLSLLLVAPLGLHPHPEYSHPLGLFRLLVASLLFGLLLGSWMWSLLKLGLNRRAKFHHPNRSTWKGLGLWGPRQRKLTSTERITFLQLMGWSDYVEFVVFVALGFAFLPLVLLCFAFLLKGPAEGLVPVFLGCIPHLLPAEIITILAGVVLATIVWPLQWLFVWLGLGRTLV